MSASIQTEIKKPAKGFKGGIANSNPTTTKNSTAEAILGVGKFCKIGTTGHTPLTAITETPDGVVVKSDAFVGSEIAIGESATICKRGDIFMYSETACVEGATVFVRCVVNGALEIGDVRDDVDGVNAVAHATAKFGETLASAGLVKIEL